MSRQEPNLKRPKVQEGKLTAACRKGDHSHCNSLRCACTECTHGATGTIGRAEA